CPDRPGSGRGGRGTAGAGHLEDAWAGRGARPPRAAGLGGRLPPGPPPARPGAVPPPGQRGWAAGYGLAAPAPGQPVTATPRFQAASLSKPVTAWGVLRLVESGPVGVGAAVIGPPATRR